MKKWEVDLFQRHDILQRTIDNNIIFSGNNIKCGLHNPASFCTCPSRLKRRGKNLKLEKIGE